MANSVYRARLTARINSAITEAAAVAPIDHDGVRGAAREVFCRQLLEPVIPTRVRAGTGIIVDAFDHQSGQLDLVVYDPSRLSPLLWDRVNGAFPLEASYCVVEVKSKLTATTLKEAIDSAKRLEELVFIPPPPFEFGPVTIRTTPMSVEERVRDIVDGMVGAPPRPTYWGPAARVIHAVFAFDSDLTVGGKSEMQRLAENCDDWCTNPPVHLVCVPGRGFWRFNPEKSAWSEHPATADRDEVIDFLGVLANGIEDVLDRRHSIKLGNYIIRPRDFDLLRPPEPGSNMLQREHVSGSVSGGA